MLKMKEEDDGGARLKNQAEILRSSSHVRSLGICSDLYLSTPKRMLHLA
jgi:hypothetical protein